MSATLNDLFDQIIHSERKAQERKNYLKEVKTKLSALEEEFEESQDENKRLKGQLLLKVQNWKQEELKLTFLTSRQTILLEQKEAMEKERDCINTQLKQLQADQLTAMASFCTETDTFSQNYDLVSFGSARREMEARKQAEELEEPEKLLTKELERYESKLSAVKELDDELNQVSQDLEERVLRSKELDQQILVAKDRVINLEKEKSEVTSLPVTGDSFKILHKELESIQCDQLEAKCQTLQKELNTLQQQLRQKALQQQQQQRILHEQQRRQQALDTAFQHDDVDKPPGSKPADSFTSNKLRVTNFSSRSMDTHSSQPPGSKPADSFTSNKLRVTNFSSRSMDTHSSQDGSSMKRDIAFVDEDFEDDMYLPDLSTFHDSNDGDIDVDSNRNIQRKSTFRPRRK